MLAHRVMQGAGGVSGGSSSGPFNNTYNYLFGGNSNSTTYLNYLHSFNGTTRTTSGSSLSQSKSSLTNCAAYLPSQSADYMFGGTLGVSSFSTVTEKWNGSSRTTTTALAAASPTYNARYTNGNDYYMLASSLYRWNGNTHTQVVATSTASPYSPSAYFPSTDVSYTFGGPGKYPTSAIIKWNGTAESTETATMPSVLDSAGSSYLTNSTIYMFGGLLGGSSGSYTNVIHKWNGSAISTETATISVAKRYLTSGFISDVIYTYGGASTTTTYHNHIEEYDGTTRTMSSATLASVMIYIGSAEL